MPSEKKQIAVRLDEETRDKVEQLAKDHHVSSGTIGIWAFHALLDYIEKSEGKITLPLDFEDTTKEQSK